MKHSKQLLIWALGAAFISVPAWAQERENTINGIGATWSKERSEIHVVYPDTPIGYTVKQTPDKIGSLGMDVRQESQWSKDVSGLLRLPSGSQWQSELRTHVNFNLGETPTMDIRMDDPTDTQDNKHQPGMGTRLIALGNGSAATGLKVGNGISLKELNCAPYVGVRTSGEMEHAPGFLSYDINLAAGSIGAEAGAKCELAHVLKFDILPRYGQEVQNEDIQGLDVDRARRWGGRVEVTTALGEVFRWDASKKEQEFVFDQRLPGNWDLTVTKRANRLQMLDPATKDQWQARPGVTRLTFVGLQKDVGFLAK